MKCLFIASKSPDYIAAGLWDGLQEVLGEENVVDLVGCPWLHKSQIESICGPRHHPEFVYISGQREGMQFPLPERGTRFDLAVINACVNYERDWTWIKESLKSWLLPDAKIAYVEGWDAAWQVEPPQIKVDAIFRREISPQVQYPYECHHLSFAMPSRMFLSDQEMLDVGKPYDVFFAGNPLSCHPSRPLLRWQMLQQLFSTKHLHHSIASSAHLGDWESYYYLLRQSKFALVPTGADDCESLRCYEAVTCGAIPIFVNYPDYRRDPWFTGEMSFSCRVEELAGHIDEAVGNDQTNKRTALMAHARKYHTTRARAEKLLEVLK